MVYRPVQIVNQSYQQYCGLARALDVAGDKWTLLILRELVPGPRRFTDLIDGLPGISRKLLTDRLRALESDGVVRREELPPPAARQVYVLTGDGRDLASAMAPLIAWGARRLGERAPGDSFQARWSAVGMAGLADREAALGVHETYQYVVGDTAFHFVVDDGAIAVHDGRAAQPAATVTCDEATWSDVLSGRVSATAAADAGALTATGDPQAMKRLRRILGRRRLFAETAR